MRLLESLEIGVARAARAEVIEPLFRFRKGHLVDSDSLKNVDTRAPDTLRVRELLEQTTAKHIEDAPLISPGICLGVQNCLLCERSSRCMRIYTRLRLIPVSSPSCASTREELPAGFFPNCSSTSFLPAARSSQANPQSFSTSSRIPA